MFDTSADLFFFSQTLHEFSIYHWKRRNIKPRGEGEKVKYLLV